MKSRSDSRLGELRERIIGLGERSIRKTHYPELRRQLEELRRREEHARQVAESLPQIIFTTGADGAVEWVNRRWEEFSGLAAEQSRGDVWIGHLHPEDIDASVAAWRAATATGMPFEHTHRFRSKSGGYRWMLVRAVPLHDRDGRVIRWFGSLTDIDDERRLRAALEQAHATLERRVAERTEELEVARARLQTLSRRLVEVQEEERRMVARELHDEAGQVLTALKVNLRLLQDEAADPAVALERIATLQHMAADAMQRIHAVGQRLRPAILDRAGLIPALEDMVDIARHAGLKAGFAAIGLTAGRLPLEVETTVYRVVQESVTNVVRHAGARHLSVLVERLDASVIALIEDDGSGFEQERALANDHLGLRSMVERAELIGGRLTIDSQPGAGTTIRLEVRSPSCAA